VKWHEVYVGEERLATKVGHPRAVAVTGVGFEMVRCSTLHDILTMLIIVCWELASSTMERGRAHGMG